MVRRPVERDRLPPAPTRRRHGSPRTKDARYRARRRETGVVLDVYEKYDVTVRATLHALRQGGADLTRV